MQATHPPFDFLVVIPAFKESARLPSYLEQLCPTLVSEDFTTAILVVDDGSGIAEQQRLLQSVNALRERCSNLLSPLLLPENSGKGAAVLAGWDAGIHARWYGFLDADGAIPASEVVRLLRVVHGGESLYHAVFASRIKMLGKKVDRSFKRHLYGRLFAMLVGVLVCPNVYDSQCGFKLLSAEALSRIRKLVLEKRFAFDVELLAALLHAGCLPVEMPVDWSDVPGSKVKLVRDTVRMFVSVLRIRQRKKTWTFSSNNS